jgi:DNA-binding Lrp family transcriptional regulator
VNRRDGGGAGVAVDATDLKILELLRDDGRISVAALGSAVGVSRANAYARLERLRTSGVVEGFTARVKEEKLGLGLTALIWLKVRSPAREELSGPLREIPGICYAAFVTGEYDVVVLVRAANVTTLRENIMAALMRQPSVRSTHTVLVLDEVVRRPFVLP